MPLENISEETVIINQTAAAAGKDGAGETELAEKNEVAVMTVGAERRRAGKRAPKETKAETERRIPASATRKRNSRKAKASRIRRAGDSCA